MSKIDHIVYIMFENRGFDSVLGWLYPDETDKPKHFIPSTSKPVFDGLQTGKYYNPDSSTPGRNIPVGKITSATDQNLPTLDPHEEFQFVHQQIYGQGSTTPNMLGFYDNFATVKNSVPEQIMQCYTPTALPVLNGLAKGFAVSDAYFSSIPTQTNCNRAFAGTGNSLGKYSGEDTTKAWVNNHWGKYLKWELDVTFNQKTVWDVLTENGHGGNLDWMIYYSDRWPDSSGEYCFTQDLFYPTMKDNTTNFASIDQFFDILNDDTQPLPKFSFLEPTWYLDVWNGTDYHPPANLGSGEQFLKKIYNALKNSNKWENTLLIINFDEHGGTYDHVVPPRAIPPWENPANKTPNPGRQNYEEHFAYDSFGVRVPLILVNPYIAEKTVIRSKSDTFPFDHTSVIATVLESFGLTDRYQWDLGSRVARASSFHDVFTLDTPRDKSSLPDFDDLPELKPVDEKEMEPSDLQLMIAHRFLNKVARKSGFSEERREAIYTKHFAKIESMYDLNCAIENVVNDLKGGLQEPPDPSLEPMASQSFWQKIIAFFKRLFGMS